MEWGRARFSFFAEILTLVWNKRWQQEGVRDRRLWWRSDEKNKGWARQQGKARKWRR
jgi:hypothetical protein